MDGLAPAQLGGQLGDHGGSLLRAGLLDAVEDGETVGRVQRIEQGAGGGGGVQGGLQVGGWRGVALAGVGLGPAAVRLGLIDLGLAARAHAAGLLQSLHPLAIGLRPGAPGPPGPGRETSITVTWRN